MPIHHLTGSSSISGQSYRGRGAAGEAPQMVSGFLTGPGSPHPTPKSHSQIPWLRPREAGFSETWGPHAAPGRGADAASAVRSLSPLPQGSGVPPQGRPAEPGGQWLRTMQHPPSKGPFCPLSSPSLSPQPHPSLLACISSTHPLLFSLGLSPELPSHDYPKVPGTEDSPALPWVPVSVMGSRICPGSQQGMQAHPRDASPPHNPLLGFT